MRDDIPPGLAVSPSEPANELHELLTVDEVAAFLKVNRHWVYEHTRSRARPTVERLPHIKIGKYLRFDPHAVRAFLARRARAR